MIMERHDTSRPRSRRRMNFSWPHVGIVAGFLVGLAITLTRDFVIPEHYTYDSQKIQAIAQGITPGYGDSTFENVANVYRFLGLANSPDFVALVGFSLASLVLVLALWRVGPLSGGPASFLVIVASFGLAAVYLGNYSKDVFVLPVVAILLLAPKRWWGDVLIVSSIAGYAVLFRQYWLIVGATYVVFRVLTRVRIQAKYLLPLGAFGAALIGLTLFLVVGVDPDHFRTIVNQTRTVEANTEIVSFVNWAQPVGGIVNVVVGFVALIIPLPLILTAGWKYFPVIAAFALFWVPILVKTWDLVPPRMPPTASSIPLKRSVSLAFAFLVTQSLFEPDYGSALRHLTPILPILVFIGLSVRTSLGADGSKEHAMVQQKPNSPSADNGSLLVVHWGQNGGGPRFAVRMAEALEGAWPGPVLTSFNSNAEILKLEATQVGNSFPVTTYRSAVGLVMGLPRLFVIGLHLRKFIAKNDVTVVYSAMLSIWQSICLYLFLPRKTRFVASIHDAVEHPGDAHWVLRACRYLDCRRADAIAVYSESARDILSTQGQTRETPIAVITHGADAPIVSARKRSGDPLEVLTLGFVGRIVEYKGLDLFVDLVKQLATEGLHVRGIVVGSGIVEPELIESSRELISWNVAWIPESAMPDVLESVDVLVLPYREASQSGVYTLALSAGVPSVATPVGGLIAQVETTGGGIVADEVSADALAKSVRAIALPATYERVSARCLSAASGVGSWSHSADMLVDFLLLSEAVSVAQKRMRR